MARSVFCLVNDRAHAEAIVSELKNIGVSNDDISILFPDKGSKRDFVHEVESKAPEGFTTGASAGAAIGGVLGWLVGMGALAIPGIGPFIAAGPIMAALSGAAIGGATAGIAGALIGLGMREDVATQYESKVKEGNILMSVHSEDMDRSSQIKEVMSRHGGKEISTTGEKGVSKEETKEGAAEHRGPSPASSH